MVGKDSDAKLLCPSSDEFADKLTEIDGQINVGKFIDMARERTLRQMAGRREKPGADASEAEREGFRRNIDFLVSLDFAYSRDEMLTEYHTLYRTGHSPETEAQAQRVLEMERAFAGQFGFDDIEETPDIDRPLSNGMTRLGQSIMLSDNVEDVRTLIEENGASPVATCGSQTPLELAEQLGRADIATYLREILKMSA